MIGIMGGTFDPIHFGHLRPALEVCERLSLTQVRFVPCWAPPHRGKPMATAEDRLRMVDLAVINTPEFYLDDRELRRGGRASYSVDTLKSLLKEFDEPLVLMLGMDAFLNFNAWRSSGDILKMAHIVVSYRPGYKIPKLEPWAKGRVVKSAKELKEHRAGKIIFLEVTQLAISATDIRRQLLDGLSARYLMPIDVADYIHQNQLYYNDNTQSQDYEMVDIIDPDCRVVLSG